ncbi:MAG: DUF1326 domain-containing protein [Candidatus Rokubacteria bacterium]|nr:DUF1326 domain-containing protein [Candidatus Rokubacteria bacterium]
MAPKWHIHGDYLLACNCDYGCPCNFNARPTMGFCQGAVGFQVTDGEYGDVRLDGQRAFVAAKWPGAIHEGNGVASIYIDEGASPAQREALVKIVSGEAGGPPWAIFAATFSHVRGPHFAKIRMRFAGKDTEVEVNGRIKISFQPIRNPVTKAEATPRVVLPQGFVFQEGDQYALKEFWVSDGPELSFAHPGKCGELAKVRWQGP